MSFSVNARETTSMKGVYLVKNGEREKEKETADDALCTQVDKLFFFLFVFFFFILFRASQSSG